MADAVCEIADAARQAFVKAGFDPGEWDGDNIVQDVKRGLVDAVETLAARSATGAMELVEQIAVCIETSTWGEATSRRSLANVIRENFGGKNSEGPPIPPAHRPVA
jgi:hypothetical protein